MNGVNGSMKKLRSGSFVGSTRSVNHAIRCPFDISSSIPSNSGAPTPAVSALSFLVGVIPEDSDVRAERKVGQMKHRRCHSVASHIVLNEEQHDDIIDLQRQSLQDSDNILYNKTSLRLHGEKYLCAKAQVLKFARLKQEIKESYIQPQQRLQSFNMKVVSLSKMKTSIQEPSYQLPPVASNNKLSSYLLKRPFGLNSSTGSPPPRHPSVLDSSSQMIIPTGQPRLSSQYFFQKKLSSHDNNHHSIQSSLKSNAYLKNIHTKSQSSNIFQTRLPQLRDDGGGGGKEVGWTATTSASSSGLFQNQKINAQVEQASSSHASFFSFLRKQQQQQQKTPQTSLCSKLINDGIHDNEGYDICEYMQDMKGGGGCSEQFPAK